MRRYLLIYFDFCIWELCNLDSLCLSLIALQNAFDEVTFFEVACSFFFVASKPGKACIFLSQANHVLLFGLKVLRLLW